LRCSTWKSSNNVLTVERAPAPITAEQRPYRPYGAVREAWAYQGREVLISGPAGTGKSRGALEKLFACAARFPKMRGLICRKVRVSLTQSALETWESKVLPEGSGIRLHHEDQEYRFPNGSTVAVAGLDDPEKIKSTEFDLIYVQEATELTQEDWLILLSRLRNGVMPYQQLMADCNPADPQHWLKLRADGGATVLLESCHEDNPSVTSEYIATLDSLTGYLYQRLRLGLWVAAEGMYFTEWNPDVHVVNKAFDPPADWPRWLAVDYGFADPFCALWFARVPVEGTIYVYRELYATGLRDEQQAELIKQRSFGESIILRILDPSMFNQRTEQQRPSIASVYANVFGQNCPVYPGMNSRKPGWSIVRRAMAYDERPTRLRVMRDRCPNLIRTIPAMVRDPLDPEDLADKVNSTKTEDHAVDALRYGLCAEAQPPTPQTRRAAFG
jgi:PBSX family phage terminase large subunit